MLNESERLAAALDDLRRTVPASWELIVVDGGSMDESATLAQPRCDLLLLCPPGRARQMNFGACLARGRYLLFLHVDSQLNVAAVQAMEQAMAADKPWGWFQLRFDGGGLALSTVAAFMGWRARLTRVCTGDQSLWLRRRLFVGQGGFADMALMEDVEIAKRLRTVADPTVLAGPVVTSARRWLGHGVLRTVLLMWALRLQYWLGASPDYLARRYYGRKAADSLAANPLLAQVPAKASGEPETGAGYEPVQARLAVFARVPRRGQVKTRLARALGDTGALEVYQQLVARVWREQQRNPAVLAGLWLDRPPGPNELDGLFGLQSVDCFFVQQGCDLGERMFRCLCAQTGPEERPSLIVGADCPTVDADYIKAALQALYDGVDLVLGPATDGGYVLIGCKQPQWSWFEGVEWGSDRVLEQTLQRAQQANSSVMCLDPRSDIDEVSDLQALAAASLPVSRSAAPRPALRGDGRVHDQFHEAPVPAELQSWAQGVLQRYRL